jgi:hypothetical protein
MLSQVQRQESQATQRTVWPGYFHAVIRVINRSVADEQIAVALSGVFVGRVLRLLANDDAAAVMGRKRCSFSTGDHRH